MNFFSRFLGRETRSTMNLSDPRLAEFLAERSGTVGAVNTARASGLAVAQACISAISHNLAAMPLNVYRRSESHARERATTHPLFPVLHDRTNDAQTAFEAREFLIVSLLTWGNAFARIERNGKGQVVALHPHDPRRVSVERLESGRLRYRFSADRGQTAVALQDEVLHLRYRLSEDGVMGQSPIQLARETFGLALTQQEQSGKQAQNAFRMEGALVFPQALSLNQQPQVLNTLRDKAAQDARTSGVMVLDGGVEFRPMSMSARDAQFLENRKLTNLDVARIFGVPPTVVGITDNATYSNVDGESKALVVRCLAPMARRIEQAMNAALLSREAQRSLYIEHDLAGLLRGDIKARYEAYRIGREWGWLSPNEIRAWENLGEIDGGSEYLTPLNMTTVDERGAGK